MIEVALMIEGQDGLTWDRWKRFAKITDEMGFAGLYRSDHYTNANPPDKDSLEAWTSLTWLASHTTYVEFGPMVSPLSFRDPTMLARMAVAVDDLSGGRLTLGVGAGWQVREHDHFGWDLLEVPERFARFEEGLEIITRLLKSDTPSTFEGEYYSIKEAILLPRPQRPSGPRILIGGNGTRRTLPLAARFADEWNAVYNSPDQFAERNQILDELARQQGRDPKSIRRSMMTGSEFGRTDAEVQTLVEKRTGGSLTPQQLRDRGPLVGTAGEFVDHFGRLAEAGCQRVMMQWLAQDDVDRLEAFASQVIPQLR